nr:MAG TPA: hypothetical protein [Caudoviricetes sp.]
MLLYMSYFSTYWNFLVVGTYVYVVIFYFNEVL